MLKCCSHLLWFNEFFWIWDFFDIFFLFPLFIDDCSCSQFQIPCSISSEHEQRINIYQWAFSCLRNEIFCCVRQLLNRTPKLKMFDIVVIRTLLSLWVFQPLERTSYHNRKKNTSNSNQENDKWHNVCNTQNEQNQKNGSHSSLPAINGKRNEKSLKNKMNKYSHVLYVYFFTFVFTVCATNYK